MFADQKVRNRTKLWSSLNLSNDGIGNKRVKRVESRGKVGCAMHGRPV